MNKRIQELTISCAGQLDWDFPKDPESFTFSQHELEKFAELIVKERIAIADDLVNRNTDGTWSSNELYTDYNGALFEVKRRIQETFGVKE